MFVEVCELSVCLPDSVECLPSMSDTMLDRGTDVVKNTRILQSSQ